MSSDSDDDAVVRRLQRGDVGALELLYRRHAARVHATCRGLLGNAADAEDAAQEVFVKVFERSASFEGRSRFATWLYQLTVNHCLHLIEKRNVRSAARLPEIARDEIASSCESPADAASVGDARDALARKLAALPLEQRTVLVLRELDGLSYDEIATVLAIPVGTVMSRLARARERWVELVHGRVSLAGKP